MSWLLPNAKITSLIFGVPEIKSRASRTDPFVAQMCPSPVSRPGAHATRHKSACIEQGIKDMLPNGAGASRTCIVASCIKNFLCGKIFWGAAKDARLLYLLWHWMQLTCNVLQLPHPYPPRTSPLVLRPTPRFV